MAYVRVSSWHELYDADERVATLYVRRQLGVLLRALPGLVAFRVFTLEGRTLVVTSIWDSPADARVGSGRSAAWLHEHVGEPRRPAEVVVVCTPGHADIGELGRHLAGLRPAS